MRDFGHCGRCHLVGTAQVRRGRTQRISEIQGRAEIFALPNLSVAWCSCGCAIFFSLYFSGWSNTAFTIGILRIPELPLEDPLPLGLAEVVES